MQSDQEWREGPFNKAGEVLRSKVSWLTREGDFSGTGASTYRATFLNTNPGWMGNNHSPNLYKGCPFIDSTSYPPPGKGITQLLAASLQIPSVPWSSSHSATPAHLFSPGRTTTGLHTCWGIIAHLYPARAPPPWLHLPLAPDQQHCFQPYISQRYVHPSHFCWHDCPRCHGFDGTIVIPLIVPSPPSIPTRTQGKLWRWVSLWTECSWWGGEMWLSSCTAVGMEKSSLFLD